MTLSLGALSVVGFAACGGTDTQPEMPDPSVVDRSADDLGLPEAEGGEESDTAGSDDAEPPAPIRVVAGQSEPIEGPIPTLRLLAPRNGQRIASGDVNVRIQLRGWELQPEPGRHVHVIVDDEPYIAVRDVSRPLSLNELVQENLGHPLSEGTHVLRVFPSRGHHESVKSAGAFAMLVFHYGRPTEGFAFDPRAPLLTYSRPKGCYTTGERILLDFFVSNVELSAEGTRVRYEIDGGAVSGHITEWVPHWIENLPEGEHAVRLTLVSAQGEPVPGPFNDTTRTIRVAESCR
jgi:hypothetical protein